MATLTTEEIQERQEHMGRNSRAFNLFEGCCPDCFHDLVDDGDGGSEEAGTRWFQFKCTGCTKVHYVEQTVGGDWATN